MRGMVSMTDVKISHKIKDKENYMIYCLSTTNLDICLDIMVTSIIGGAFQDPYSHANLIVY